MSQYGPPGSPQQPPSGGGPSGQSRDPWPGHPDEQTYGQPVDPWADQDPSGGASAPLPPAGSGGLSGFPADPGHSGTGQPGAYPPAGAPGYPPTHRYEPGLPPTSHLGPTWSTIAAPPAAPGGNRKLITVLVLLAVLLLGGGIAAVRLIDWSDDPDRKNTADPSRTPTASPRYTPTEPVQPPDPTPESSTNALLVQAGQCVLNEGTEDEPELVITECAPETWRVLKRIDGPTSGEEDAEEKCEKVEGYKYWYFFDSPLDSLDYVLCLEEVESED